MTKAIFPCGNALSRAKGIRKISATNLSVREPGLGTADRKWKVLFCCKSSSRSFSLTFYFFFPELVFIFILVKLLEIREYTRCTSTPPCRNVNTMNSLGWALIMKSGCFFCAKETVNINSTKYIVRDHLAQGGFSLIDLAESTITHRLYALKRITCHSIDDQNIALREIENCRRLDSENVIKVIDYELKGSADIVINTTSILYIVLPFYKNGSLSDHLQMRARKQDHMPEAQILQIFLGICNGVKAIHEAKPVPLAHRDLKTANICLSDSFEPIIVDLGSMTEARLQICGQTDAQRLQDEAEERSSIVYRAPELFSVKSYCTIDERTDIWSLGCVLYAMCFFHCPFDPIYEKGDSVALAVLSGNLNIPENSIYSDDMHELIEYMLRMDPMERPFIYSVIEKTHDLVQKLEGRV